MIERFPHPDGLAAPNGYSHAVAATGRLVVISGQLPVDTDGTLVGPGDGAAQAERVFANVAAALAAAGAGPEHVIRLAYYVTDLADVPAVRVARDAFLGGENAGDPPASSLVQVAGLVLPGARIEIDAFAVVG